MSYDSDTTIKDTTIKDTTIKDTTIKDPTIKDPTIKDPTIKDPTVKDPASNGRPSDSADAQQLGPSVETPLVDVLSYYAQAGFDGDAFASDDGLVLCATCNSKVAPDHVNVHSIRRLEGASDPADMVGVLALVCPVCGTRSTCVLKYGPEVSPEEAAIWHRTTDLRHSDQLPPNMAPGEDDPDVQPAAHADER